MGAKHPLGLWEGATENATVCQGLLTNLGSRGLRTDRSLLVIVDGAKALDTAVTQTVGRAALVQRSSGTLMTPAWRPGSVSQAQRRHRGQTPQRSHDRLVECERNLVGN